MSLANAIATVRETFSVRVADSPALVREAHLLRYQVYCVENEYLEADGLEVDEFDLHSEHVILRDRESDEAVGTARLVLWQPDQPDESFPLQSVTQTPLRGHVPLSAAAEVSRFALSKQRRETVAAMGGLLRLALIQGLVRLSAEKNLSHWVAVMEPSLLRLLRGSGIYFHNLGQPVEYHGLRQPCYNSIDALLARVHAERPLIWELLTDRGRLWSPPQKIRLAA